MFQKSKDYKKSLDYYKKALDQSVQIGSKSQVASALEGLAKTYELMGDFANSLKFYKDFKQAQDSVFSAESAKYISELREKYEAGQRDQKIKQLHAEASLQDFKIQSQKSWLIVSILGLILVIGFSIIMLIQRNQKHRAYQDLLRKNIENIRIEKQNEKLDVAGLNDNSFENIGAQTSDIETSQEKYKTSALEQFQKEIIHKRIKFVMDQRKLFLQPDLTIEKLAIEIKTNKSYISQVINETQNQNFSSFLNDYRIREARRLLIDPEFRNITIESIAGMVGFNSKSAFNNAFKRFTGLTPSFFLKNTQCPDC
jgi:AraC-like DNA-binding protein